MKDPLFIYREWNINKSYQHYWLKKNKSTLSEGIHSLLTIDSVGTMRYDPEEAYLLSKRNRHWSFHIVTEGNGSFRLHGKTFYFSPGNMFVIAPQFSNVIFNIASPDLVLKNIFIENSIGVQDLCQRDVPDVTLFHPADLNKLLSIHNEILYKMEHQLNADVTAVSILQSVFSFLYEVEHQCFEMEYSDPVNMIYHKINSFPDKSYSIRELAQNSGLNIRTLQRKFKKQIGCSIQDLITTCRICLARNLLINTFLPIAEIASRCCYKDVCFFSKIFKEKTGVSPNDFRKKNSVEKNFTNTSNLTTGIKSTNCCGTKELSPPQKQLLWLINEQRNISIRSLAAKMNSNTSAVQKHIESLKREKILHRSGSRRGGYWIITHP